MFIRFTQTVDAGSGVLYERDKPYDLDRAVAQAYITQGVAVATPIAPIGYGPGSVGITGGTINSTPIGATTRSSVAATTLQLDTTDSTGTPGNVTNNNVNGRAAFAAAASAVVVTNSRVGAADTVHATLLGAADATLTNIVGVTVAAGSFTVTGNAAASATKGFMFTVIKA